MLALPEEPATELLACPVVEEVGFLDLLIFVPLRNPREMDTVSIKTERSVESDEVGKHRRIFRTISVTSSEKWRDTVLTGCVALFCLHVKSRREEEMGFYLFTAGFFFFPSSHILLTYLQKFIFPRLNYVDRFSISTR